jgi:CheY-like chemotaxis protein
MNIRILVATNDQVNFELVKTALAAREIDIVRASGMALALFLTKKNQPVLIISDLELIDGDGISLLREIKSDSQLAAIPFVFLLRQKPAESVIKNLFEKGATAILSNVKTPDDLVPILEELIVGQEMPSERRESESSE